MKYTLKHTATLLEAVMEAYRGISKQKAKQLIGHSEIRINGQKTGHHPQNQIEAGSLLEIISVESNVKSAQPPGRKNPVAIYFEDDYLIAAIKPAGILTCRSKETETGLTYHNLLENFLSEREGEKIRLWVIHRLDREVEGLILFAKSEEIQQKIKNAWQSVTKKYLALTENKPDPAHGIIENWLLDTPSQKVEAYSNEVPGSKRAKSEYTFLRKENNYYLVEVTLFSGRKNQIRVHLAGINCPIVGDRKYGADASVIRQIRLAACYLEFPHPVSSRKVILQYKPPARFFNPKENEDEKYRII